MHNDREKTGSQEMLVLYGGNVTRKDPMRSELVAYTGWGLTAMGAACAMNLLALSTSVCCKCFKVDTTKRHQDSQSDYCHRVTDTL